MPRNITKFKLNRPASRIDANSLRAFFMSRWYPIHIAILLVAGRITELEIYIAAYELVLISLALLVCDTLRPLIPTLITFLYRISLAHSPGVPYFSDYFYGGTKMALFIIAAAVAFFALGYFVVKNRIFSNIDFKKTPLLIPIALLSLSFTLGGAFTDGWSISDFWFALLQVLVFGGVFLLLYFGLRKERVDELCDYFVYVSAVCAVVLIAEVVDLYLNVDTLFTNGTINKTQIFFGWGISNTCGGCLTALVPICFLGVIRSRHSLVYFSIATLAMLATVLTLSRNAILFGTLFYITSLIVCCFKGKKRWLYKKIAIAYIPVALIIFLILQDKISTMLANMTAMGFDSNGRYELWRIAGENFRRSPIFGIGYFSYKCNVFRASSFTPQLAHNTIFQVFSSMGIVGMMTYGLYRVTSLAPFFEKPRVEKTMLLLSVGVLLSESLLDNFIFWFNPTFVYNICIVIATMYNEQYERQELTKR